MAMMPSTEEELNDSMAVIPVLLVEEEDERYGRSCHCQDGRDSQ